MLLGIDAVQGENSGGWIGLGLSEAGGMKGSDIWVLGPYDDLAPFYAWKVENVRMPSILLYSTLCSAATYALPTIRLII